MTKVIRRPLTDINGNDFMTGIKVISEGIIEQEKNQKSRVSKWLKQKQSESNIKGKIYVEGFGFVNI